MRLPLLVLHGGERFVDQLVERCGGVARELRQEDVGDVAVGHQAVEVRVVRVAGAVAEDDEALTGRAVVLGPLAQGLGGLRLGQQVVVDNDGERRDALEVGERRLQQGAARLHAAHGAVLEGALDPSLVALGGDDAHHSLVSFHFFAFLDGLPPVGWPFSMHYGAAKVPLLLWSGRGDRPYLSDMPYCCRDSFHSHSRECTVPERSLTYPLNV